MPDRWSEKIALATREALMVAMRGALLTMQERGTGSYPRLHKLAAALTGATINLIFIDHFQEMSRAHFTVRRLERIYGADAVRQAYADGNAGATPSPNPT